VARLYCRDRPGSTAPVRARKHRDVSVIVSHDHGHVAPQNRLIYKRLGRPEKHGTTMVDGMGLSEIERLIKENPDEEARCGIVRRLKDARLLAEIAAADPHVMVREAAVKRLTDGEALARILADEPDYGVRRAAVDRVDDQRVLAEVALKDPDWLVRLSAVARLGDRETLARIANGDASQLVREVAMRQLRS
jgi:hypothetical protein